MFYWYSSFVGKHFVEILSPARSPISELNIVTKFQL